MPLLQKIQEIDEIDSIIPGRIRPIKGQNSTLLLKFTTFTDSGLKYLAKSERAVQEVFIVCEERERVRGIIDGMVEG